MNMTFILNFTEKYTETLRPIILQKKQFETTLYQKQTIELNASLTQIIKFQANL